MTFVRSFLLLVFALFLSFPFSVQAEEPEPYILSTDEVFRFVQSLGKVQEFADRLEYEGKLDVMKSQNEHMLNRHFKIYSGNLEDLKVNNPDEYTNFETLVAEYEFPSADEWGRIGDAVMAAYFANSSTSTKTQYAVIKQKLTPEMMAMLPPEAKAKLDGMLDMTKALQEVPGENRDIVKPYTDKIDYALLKAEGRIKTPYAP